MTATMLNHTGLRVDHHDGPDVLLKHRSDNAVRANFETPARDVRAAADQMSIGREPDGTPAHYPTVAGIVPSRRLIERPFAYVARARHIATFARMGRDANRHRGHDVPGAEFVSDGVPLHNGHVAVQIGNEPVGLVRGDADSARWDIDVRTIDADGGVDLREPAVHGKKGERFLYLTWG